MAGRVRWGILGTGKIASDFTSALRMSDNAIVAAVGSRTQSSADEFARVHGIAKAHGSYEALVADADVDAIYVSTPHPGHKDATLLALKNKKHVLCEKPMAMNLKEVKQMVELAQSSKLFLMEAMWTRFFPAYDHIRKVIKNGILGEVKALIANFGFKHTGKVERLYNPELGGGALLDIGIYPLALAFDVFGCKPSRIQATGLRMDTGVDETVSFILEDQPGQFASIFTTFSCDTPCDAVIVGTKGSVRVHKPMWHPQDITITIDGKEEHKSFPAPAPPSDFPSMYFDSTGMVYEAQAVSECILKGQTESDLMTLEHTLAMAETLDELRRQVGVVYKQDS
eukprot:TRINITY_DN1029_c0_g2_i3.p1 TRINITY_DN1029_c0_g2~~TRINITY_DN1029_c0_g2_i3.p1  ORF type:complete len:340 (+),score=62.84 TRINITY_DN1029_c0_g2_i3:20-1039(+)